MLAVWDNRDTWSGVFPGSRRRVAPGRPGSAWPTAPTLAPGARALADQFLDLTPEWQLLACRPARP